MALLEGYYINEQDLYVYQRKDLLDAITVVIKDDVTNIQQAIINRSKYADTLLANRYKVPFASDSDYITEALKAAISHLVLYDLLGYFNSVSDHEEKVRSGKAKEADQFLKDIRDSKQDLITELDPDTNDKVERNSFDSVVRIDRNFR